MTRCDGCSNCTWKSGRPGACDGTGWIRVEARSNDLETTDEAPLRGARKKDS